MVITLIAGFPSPTVQRRLTILAKALHALAFFTDPDAVKDKDLVVLSVFIEVSRAHSSTDEAEQQGVNGRLPDEHYHPSGPVSHPHKEPDTLPSCCEIVIAGLLASRDDPNVDCGRTGRHFGGSSDAIRGSVPPNRAASPANSTQAARRRRRQGTGTVATAGKIPLGSGPR
jgi:hypothetical protein